MNKIITSSIAALAIAASAQAATIPFDLNGTGGIGLRGSNENPAVVGGGSGGEAGAGITFNDVTLILTLNLAWGATNGFINLTGDATAGHIHGPTASTGAAAFTQNAGVLIGLNTLPGWNANASAGGLTNGQVTLTAPQATNLLAGQLYVNVHTATNGGGEVRGNLVQAPEPASAVLLGLGTLLLAARRRRNAQA